MTGSGLPRDVRFAVRQLVKSPGVAAVAVLSLALGIGANAAIFSGLEQILLRPLPVHQPDRLVNLSAPGPKAGWVSCNSAGSCEEVFSYPMFRDLEEGAGDPFTGIAAHFAFWPNLAIGDQSVSGLGLFVSGSYFPVLGLQPALGRLLGPEDDRIIGGHPVAVLSHRFWASRLGADPEVLGRDIVVSGESFTVVGVAPPGFAGTTLQLQADVFVPLTMRGAVSPSYDGFEDRTSHSLYLFARLRPGVSLENAQEAINRVFRPILLEVEAPLQEGLSEAAMARFQDRHVVLDDGRRGQSLIHAEARTPAFFLFGITGMVLLIACANVANLLLARGTVRRREFAIRGALGAGRSRLVGQLLTEACLLAFLGGAASLLVAHWTMSAVLGFLPAELGAALDLRLSPPVLFFVGAVALGVGVAVGLYPALQFTRAGAVSALRGGVEEASGGSGAARFRTSLATAQIALSTTLLICAGLFVRSLVQVGQVETGLEVENVVTFTLSPGQSGYAPPSVEAVLEQVEEELAVLPGVTSVSAAFMPILRESSWSGEVSVDGFEAGPDTNVGALTNWVGPDYFQTLGIPVLAGREFTASDRASAPRVAIVNQAFAWKFGLDPRDVVGSRMAVGRDQAALDIEIVGFVADAVYPSPKDPPAPLYVLPWRQRSSLNGLTFYVRTATDPTTAMASIPGLVRRIDPSLPVEPPRTLEDLIRESLFVDRMISALAASFAVLATLLAAVGLFGVLAYTVARRTREIGVRMALGARAEEVQGMVLRQVGWMTLVGVVIGVAAALGLGRVVQSLLFEVQGHDPWAVAAGVVLLTLAALAAGILPARRAARVDPMEALRAE